MLDNAIEEYGVRIYKEEDEVALHEFQRTQWFYDPVEPMEPGDLAIGMHTLEGSGSIPTYWRAAADHNYVVFGELGVRRWVTAPVSRGYLYFGYKFEPGYKGLVQTVTHEAGHTIRENMFKYLPVTGTWQPISSRAIRERNANEHVKKYFPE